MFDLCPSFFNLSELKYWKLKWVFLLLILYSSQFFGRRQQKLFVFISSDCCNKIPRALWLQQQEFISHSSGVWGGPRSRYWPIKFPDEGSLPGLQIAAFSLGPSMAEKEESRSLVSFPIRTSISSWGLHLHDFIETKLPPKGPISKHYQISG